MPVPVVPCITLRPATTARVGTVLQLLPASISGLSSGLLLGHHSADQTLELLDRQLTRLGMSG